MVASCYSTLCFGALYATWICLRCCLSFYHGQSPFNHHLGNICLFFNHLKQIKVCEVWLKSLVVFVFSRFGLWRNHVYRPGFGKAGLATTWKHELDTTPSENEGMSPEQGPFLQGHESSSKRQFSGDMLVFGGSKDFCIPLAPWK